MASAKLELVRSIFAAWERGDFSSADWADPAIEFVVADGPTAGSWKGAAAVALALRDLLSAWEELAVEAEEYRELDGGRVLVYTRNSGRGKTSGLKLGEIHSRTATLFYLRGGSVSKLVLYRDRQRALADLGLALEGDSPGS